jgi:hypothetical protein
VNDDLKGGFRDLRELNATARDGVSPLGYKSERRGKNRREEYWIPDATFEEVAGGAEAATALKREHFERGPIVTHGKANKLSDAARGSNCT